MLFDAHIHLADEHLKDSLSVIRSIYESIHLARAIVIGTSPDDWPKALELTKQDERFIPAVGLHPWKVNQATAGWQEQFLSYLDEGVTVIGEIGLDQWVEGYDIERQEKAFAWQLSVAAGRNLPTSIHCLKAHQPLLKTLRSVTLPDRGFKLHAYNGPEDTMQPLLDLGAYFSFNAGQFKPNAKRVYELIKRVPDDRLLIETDAPNFLPPSELREFELDNFDLSHPGNIRSGYRAIAKERTCSVEDLAAKVAENFQRYFLDDSGGNI